MTPGIRQKGFILVAVLWLLAIFGIVALGYSRTTRSKSLELANELRLAGEEYAHWNGLEKAMFHADLYRKNRERFHLVKGRTVLTEEQRALMWYPRHETYPVTVDGQSFFVRVEQAGSRIAVNSMTPEMWSEMFFACGIEDERVHEEIEAALADWQDADSLLHPEGAEQEYYDGLDPAYACKNAPLDVMEELLLVRGITPELFWGTSEHPGLVHFLCVEGKSDKLDINGASPASFKIVRGLAEEDVKAIVKMRQERPFATISEAAELVPLEAAGELAKFFHVLPDSEELRLIIGSDPDPGPDVRTTTRTFSR